MALAVTSGLSRGSGLWPILTLLYNNDLLENITSQVELFADDNTVYFSHHQNVFPDSEAGVQSA